MSLGERSAPCCLSESRSKESLSDHLESARRVSATALCADASEVVMLRLTFESVRAQCVRDVVGDRLDDPSAAPTTFLVRLIAGEPKDLFEIDARRPKRLEFAVCRVGGEPCIVRLQIDGAAGAPVTTAAKGASGPCVASPATVATVHPRKARFGRRRSCCAKAAPSARWKSRWPMRRTSSVRLLALLRATLAKDDAEWLANVNAYVEQFGIAPIRLENTNASRFLRLAADAPRTVSGGPLVTVIMPAFNAEKTLALAAGSILKQSWTELELIIVDDCSSDATCEIAQRIARLDPRAKVVRNNVNVGPYVSKNVALSMARGAYITCHDADDWAHPQRLENQIEAMKSNGARACVASWLRLDEAGGFGGFTTIGRQSHDGALRLAHVTCMIEADFMRRYVGHWDCVRFGADGEMLERLERLLGEDLLRLRQLSVLSLDAPRSLTNDAVHGISKSAGLSPTRQGVSRCVATVACHADARCLH